MEHNFLSEKQVSEIEDRYKSLLKLVMMDVDVLIKEVQAYRELLQDIDEEKPKVSEIGRIDDDLLADYHDVLTPKDIQNILGIGRRQTYELMNSGEFPVVRVGRLMRISKRVFLNWLKG